MYLRPNAILSQIREAVELVKGRSKWPVKIEWALQRGGRSAHPFSWLLSSPQQPLETEDPPTVSLAPQYTSQHLCRARVIFSRMESHEKSRFCSKCVPAGRVHNASLSLCVL